ncbi:MAG TPA: hypothetical protein VNQ76_13895 [Planctomicrobium sp.]|nr:hypothetical protein [Planctomicrobium sp.]
MHKYSIVLFCAGLLLAYGCGSKVDGPQRYQLTGKVTFNGNPVPIGVIYLTPDTSKGNRGPGTLAEIKDGRYSTPPNKGTVGGAMVLEFSGFDGQKTGTGDDENRVGKTLFDGYRLEAELPQKSAQQDFDVPLSAAGGKKP